MATTTASAPSASAAAAAAAATVASAAPAAAPAPAAPAAAPQAAQAAAAAAAVATHDPAMLAAAVAAGAALPYGPMQIPAYPGIVPGNPAAAVLQSPNNASLYVGDLDPAINEAMLFEVFSTVGQVASIRICRDSVMRRSLGYGYVNYLNLSDAERALESLNYTPIRGTPVRIMWSNRDPTLRRSGTGNIFIKNLHVSIDNKALHDTFSAFGNILSCKVAMDGESSKGYGFVHYETTEMAENAIKHVNGMLLNDQQVYVGLHISKKERVSKIEEERANFTNIFVKNIDASVEQPAFEKMFEAFGAIRSAVLMVDAEGKSREFGFVNYENHEDARRAVEEMNEKEIAGKQLYVGRAQKKIEREDELRRQYERIREEKQSKYQGVNLYVKNLDISIDDDKLRQEFSVFGAITSSKVMLDDKTGVSKGFGFVCFSNQDEATKAVTEMNGRMISGKPIYVALAQRKEARRLQLSNQIQQRNMRMQAAMVPGMPTGYNGGPIFYGAPGAMPPQARGFYPPQHPPGSAAAAQQAQQMMGRPRWPAPMPVPGQPPMPPQAGFAPQQYPMAPMQGVRPPRQQRPTSGRGQPGIAGGPAQGGVPSQQGPRGPMPAGSYPPLGQPGQSGPMQPPMPGAGMMPPQSRNRGPGGYKYTPNARNAPNGSAPGAINGAAPGAGPARPTINAASLAALPLPEQKRTLGEVLFPLVAGLTPPPMTGKVTGMLLEMDNGELLHLLESPEALGVKVGEALAALEEHLRSQDQAAAPSAPAAASAAAQEGEEAAE